MEDTHEAINDHSDCLKLSKSHIMGIRTDLEKRIQEVTGRAPTQRLSATKQRRRPRRSPTTWNPYALGRPAQRLGRAWTRRASTQDARVPDAHGGEPREV